MDTQLPPFFIAGGKLVLAIVVATYVVGIVWLVADAPCSNVGAYIVMSSMVLTAISACVLIARALLTRTVFPLILAFAMVPISIVQYLYFAFTALMLCRGV